MGKAANIPTLKPLPRPRRNAEQITPLLFLLLLRALVLPAPHSLVHRRVGRRPAGRSTSARLTAVRPSAADAKPTAANAQGTGTSSRTAPRRKGSCTSSSPTRDSAYAEVAVPEGEAAEVVVAAAVEVVASREVAVAAEAEEHKERRRATPSSRTC